MKLTNQTISILNKISNLAKDKRTTQILGLNSKDELLFIDGVYYDLFADDWLYLSINGNEIIDRGPLNKITSLGVYAMYPGDPEDPLANYKEIFKLNKE